MKSLSLALILVAVTLMSFTFGKTDYKKDISKTWTVDSNTKALFKNKYGKIDIKTWDKNVVDIKVTITVKTKSKSDADNVFERINVEFSERGNVIQAITKIDSKKGFFSFFSWNSDDYSIDWIVYLPKSIELKLSNKYGNTLMPEMDGDLEIDIKYGDLNLEKTNNCKLQMGYGDADIESCNNCLLNIKYSEIEIKEAGDLKIDTKYSKLFIDNAVKMKVKSKYDEFKIGSINHMEIKTGYSKVEIASIENLDMNSSYTEFEADLISNSAFITSKYGEVEINSLQDRFDKFDIDTKYSDVKIKIKSNINYKGDFYSKYGEISVPSNFDVTHNIDDSGIEQIKGFAGDESNSSIIKIKTEYSDIKIK